MMFPLTKPCALAALTACLMLGAPTKARAQYARRTAIVEAVDKVKDGIIAMRVVKQTGYGGTSSIAGTGVVVDERGYGITNQHVIADAEKITVTFADKSTCEARVLIEDVRHDLAILRLPARKKLK